MKDILNTFFSRADNCRLFFFSSFFGIFVVDNNNNGGVWIVDFVGFVPLIFEPTLHAQLAQMSSAR